MKQYDVVIIGAGIGGLVAGTYLSRQGLKVLVLEKREKVGGYCGSFHRDGFIYDDAVHYINNMGPGGVLRRICEELDIFSLLRLVRIDPSDRLKMPGIDFAIYNDISRTIEELIGLFPAEEEGITRFFRLITQFKFSELYAQYHLKTFEDVLREFFKDASLRTALGIFATTLGLLPDKLSGLAGLAYYRGSIIDGGYHPIGGAQQLSDILLKKLTENGGMTLISTVASRILMTAGHVDGVEIEGGEQIRARAVISNCDATYTFAHLLKGTSLADEGRNRTEKMRPSLSNFIVYLGLKGSLAREVPSCCNYWYFPYRDYSKASVDITEDDRSDGFAHISFPSLHDRSMAPEGFESIMIFTGASYKDPGYWEARKEHFMETMIKRAGVVIPRIQDRISGKFAATPHTLCRYTGNREGSYRGWAPTLEQTKNHIIGQRTEIPGLFLAGHWVTSPIGHGGVSMVAQAGRTASKLVSGYLERQCRKAAHVL